MKRLLITAVLALAFAATYALAQTTTTAPTTTTTTPATTITPTTTTTQPTTPAIQPGATTQTTTTPTIQPGASTQTTMPTIQPGATTQTATPTIQPGAGTGTTTPAVPQVQPNSTGTTNQQPRQQLGPGVPASAVSQNPGTSPGVPAASLGATANSMDLQTRIQTAIQSNPTLAATGLTVTVGPSSIEILGSVQNDQQRQAALSIVQSFAQNRSVVDHVSVFGTTPPQ